MILALLLLGCTTPCPEPDSDCCTTDAHCRAWYGAPFRCAHATRPEGGTCAECIDSTDCPSGMQCVDTDHPAGGYCERGS